MVPQTGNVSHDIEQSPSTEKGDDATVSLHLGQAELESVDKFHRRDRAWRDMQMARQPRGRSFTQRDLLEEAAAFLDRL